MCQTQLDLYTFHNNIGIANVWKLYLALLAVLPMVDNIWLLFPRLFIKCLNYWGIGQTQIKVSSGGDGVKNV